VLPSIPITFLEAATTYHGPSRERAAELDRLIEQARPVLGEIRVRRPRQGRPGRKAFVSGKIEQNTIKTTVVADHHGATLWCGATRPGRMHDLTAIRVEGADALLDAYPDVQLLVDAGYQGLARDHPDQVSAPPRELRPEASPEQQSRWEHDGKHQSSQRIAVEHTIAEPKWWRVLQRFTGRRDDASSCPLDTPLTSRIVDFRRAHRRLETRIHQAPRGGVDARDTAACGRSGGVRRAGSSAIRPPRPGRRI
jgi:hypothetical protein